MRGILLAPALLVAAPASAQPAWENVALGMTRDEARALYPAGERIRHRADRITIRGHRIVEQCRADVHILHPRGTVAQVVLRGEPAIAAQCGEAVFASLRERLGIPLSEETSRPSILKRVRTTYLWSDGGRYLRFVRYGVDGMGAGLTNASWEMSVSATAAAPEL